MLRILYSLVMIGDLFGRIFDLKAHYTDEGIILRSLAMQIRFILLLKKKKKIIKKKWLI